MEQQFSPMIIFQESLGRAHTSITSLILLAPLCRTSHYLHVLSRERWFCSAKTVEEFAREGRRVVAINGVGVSYWTQSPESSSPFFFFFFFWSLGTDTISNCFEDRGVGGWGGPTRWSGMQLLIVVASLVGEQRLEGARASVVAAHTLISCGAHT